jgi:hypothetical protein
VDSGEEQQLDRFVRCGVGGLDWSPFYRRGRAAGRRPGSTYLTREDGSGDA